MIIKGSREYARHENILTFKADLVCEFCGAAETITAYDTEDFHARLLPAHACPVCRRASEHQTSAPLPSGCGHGAPGYPVSVIDHEE